MTDPFSLPANPSQGPWRDKNGQTRWQLWAPHCDQVGLVIWRDGVRSLTQMTSIGDGFFSHTGSNAGRGLRYAFQLSDGQVRPDPASRWQPEGVHEPSALYFPDEFAWTDHDWRGVPTESLVIYELHVGTFTPEGTFAAVIARLPELVELDVTAYPLNASPLGVQLLGRQFG